MQVLLESEDVDATDEVDEGDASKTCLRLAPSKKPLQTILAAAEVCATVPTHPERVWASVTMCIIWFGFVAGEQVRSRGAGVAEQGSRGEPLKAPARGTATQWWRSPRTCEATD